ncbi:MFS transporter [Chromohalobacter sp. 296-RDG]|uniref:MFS transporter n=1 Tax=Chromohalobacter sp. 296-RDG TaxID=2994062 RepID=UPI0024698558|nr:MFS transporter [Chromohalobacter sp. 296-RDG]
MQHLAQNKKLPICIWWLFLGTLLNRLGTLVPAFLTLYLQLQKDADTTVVGLLTGTWGAGATFGALVGGVVSDRFGPRGAIASAQVITLLSCIGLFLSSDVVSLVPIIFFLGCASSFARPAAGVVISNELPSAKHIRAFGIVYWASNIGSAFSFIISGMLVELSPEFLLLFNSCTAFLYLLISTRLPRIDSVAEKRSSYGQVVLKTFSPFLNPKVLAFLSLVLVLSLIYLQKQSTLPLDMTEKGISPTAFGVVLSLNGILIILFQPLVTSLFQNVDEKYCFSLAALLLGCGFGLNAISTTTVSFALSLTVWTAGEILLIPQVSSFLLKIASEGENGTYQGAFYFVWSLGLALGAPVGLAVFHAFGGGVVWGACLVAGILVSVLFMLSLHKIRGREAESGHLS